MNAEKWSDRIAHAKVTIITILAILIVLLALCFNWYQSEIKNKDLEDIRKYKSKISNYLMIKKTEPRLESLVTFPGEEDSVDVQQASTWINILSFMEKIKGDEDKRWAYYYFFKDVQVKIKALGLDQMLSVSQRNDYEIAVLTNTFNEFKEKNNDYETIDSHDLFIEAIYKATYDTTTDSSGVDKALSSYYGTVHENSTENDKIVSMLIGEILRDRGNKDQVSLIKTIYDEYKKLINPAKVQPDTTQTGAQSADIGPVTQDAQSKSSDTTKTDGQSTEEENPSKIKRFFQTAVRNIPGIVIYTFLILVILYYRRLLIKRIKSTKVEKTIADEITTKQQDIKEIKQYCDSIKDNEFPNTIAYYLRHIRNSIGDPQFFIMHESLYEEYETAENEANYRIQEIYLWIIRLGILGTLIGIAQAFYEMATGFANGYEGAMFRESLIKAVSGNAMSVLTSVAAHGATLVLEVLIGTEVINKLKPIRDLNRVYRHIVSKMERKTIDEQVEKLKGSIDDFGDWVKKLKEEVDAQSIAGMKAKLRDINIYVNDVKSELEKSSLNTEINSTLTSWKTLHQAVTNIINAIEGDKRESKPGESIPTSSAGLVKILLELRNSLTELQKNLPDDEKITSIKTVIDSIEKIKNGISNVENVEWESINTMLELLEKIGKIARSFLSVKGKAK